MRVLTFAAVLTSSAAALANPSYTGEVPNGRTFNCRTCHESSGGGEGWNAFGQALLIEGGANPDANPDNQNDGYTGSPADHWGVVCPDDSDDDGATNGEELGDPSCTWAPGDPNPDVEVSNPGDPASVPGDTGGEGEGEGDPVGGCAATGTSSSLGLLAGLALVLRRKRRA